jgi:hypothetical protein
MAQSPQKITAKLERIPPSLVCPFPDISSQAMWIFDPAAKNAVSVRRFITNAHRRSEILTASLRGNLTEIQ